MVNDNRDMVNVPLLSIVMPVFNHPDFVLQMWRCIQGNTFSDWELLAVDDGSDKDVFDSLAAYAATDTRIRYASRTAMPKGAQTCRNIGFWMARGKYVIFFDSDDYITPDCLRERVEALEKNPELDYMVFPSGIVKDGVFMTEAHEFDYGYHVFRDDFDAFARRILPFVVWNNIYRTEALRRTHITWDERLLSLQDADFNVRVMLAGLKYDYFHGKPQFGYRIDAGSGSVSKKATFPAYRESTLYAIDRFYTLYQDRFGHKYDRALYHGTLFLYNWIQTDGIDRCFASGMADVVYRHSKVYGLLLKAQVTLTGCLAVALPCKRARQIPMLAHLIDYYRRIHKKVAAIKGCGATDNRIEVK